jgi:hypothetical protein
VRFKLFALGTIFSMTLMSPTLSLGQNPATITQRQHSLGTPGDDQESEERARIEKEQAKKANRERQEQLEKDTSSLLKLATELKQSVEQSNEHTLSLEVIKKAEEIEKLAHRVKEKMKAN